MFQTRRTGLHEPDPILASFSPTPQNTFYWFFTTKICQCVYLPQDVFDIQDVNFGFLKRKISCCFIQKWFLNDQAAENKLVWGYCCLFVITARYIIFALTHFPPSLQTSWLCSSYSQFKSLPDCSYRIFTNSLKMHVAWIFFLLYWSPVTMWSPETH